MFGIYNFFFHRSKHSKKGNRNNIVLHILAPSIIGICTCAVCLCGTSWAWFTASTQTEINTIRSATFQISDVIIKNSDIATAENLDLTENGTFTTKTLEPGNYILSFKKSVNNSSSNGHCCIDVTANGDSAFYYTNNIGDDIYTVNIITAKEITVTIKPIWGDVSDYAIGNIIVNNGNISV